MMFIYHLLFFVIREDHVSLQGTASAIQPFYAQYGPWPFEHTRQESSNTSVAKTQVAVGFKNYAVPNVERYGIYII